MTFLTVSKSLRIPAVIDKESIQLSALLLVGQLISAMPFEQVTHRNLPRDVVHLAHDEVNGQYLAYNRDGSLYGKYRAQTTRDVSGPCAPLPIEQAQQRRCFQ